MVSNLITLIADFYYIYGSLRPVGQFFYKFLLFFIVHNENCWIFQKFCHLQYKKDETWFEISHVYSISYPYSNPKMFSLK